MNLYEILEVNENASQETINKIYKIQAKRYHPDLQKTQAEKKKAEEKMKQINDAYSILSNEQKRKEYDEDLKQARLKKEQESKAQIINEMRQNYEIEQQRYTAKNTNNENNSNVPNSQINNNNKKQIYTKKDYIKDYNRRLKQFKWQLFIKRLKENLITIFIMAVIITFIWFFPPTHRYIMKIYEENTALQFFMQIFVKFIKVIKETIIAMFK